MRERENSLVVQWLELYTLIAEASDLIPGQGTKVPLAMQCNPPPAKKKKKKILNEGEREKVEKAIKSDRERETSGLSHDVYPVVNFCNISS